MKSVHLKIIKKAMYERYNPNQKLGHPLKVRDMVIMYISIIKFTDFDV